MTETLTIRGRMCRLFGAERPDCILIQPSARHESATLDSEAIKIAAFSEMPSVLVAIELDDWVMELMPWADRNISREEDAGEHASETLGYILDSLIPDLRTRFGEVPLILGGYSLGGLFALWAATRTDCFQAVAAASPSVWIKDWLSFARKNPLQTEHVYLSLGDREEHVKNQAMARVGDVLRAYYALLKEQLGENCCTLVFEEGGHFADNDGRLARAFAWCINNTLR